MISAPRPKPRRFAVVLAICLGLFFAFLIFKSPEAIPPISILPASYKIPHDSGPWPDRWIPYKWGWLWKARYSILGRTRQAGLNIWFIQATNTADGVAAQYALGPARSVSNGLSVWTLPEVSFKAMKHGAAIEASPRITTANRMKSIVTVNGSLLRYQVELFPRLRGKTVDLTVLPEVSSQHSNMTNFAAAVRAQLAYTDAVFLLDTRQPQAGTNRFGILITADEYDSKGRKVPH